MLKFKFKLRTVSMGKINTTESMESYDFYRSDEVSVMMFESQRNLNWVKYVKRAIIRHQKA